MAPFSHSTSRYEFPETHSVTVGKSKIWAFAISQALESIMEDGNLGISEYLDQMRHDPFFLVAGTGLGKTVVVPMHVWLRQCERVSSGHKAPTTWIVEPRVLIADDQARYMDSSVRKILRANGGGKVPPIFGSVTSKGVTNPVAPIRFVTTGVFTAKALAGDFDNRTDRVVIDEAHETIAQNPDVELGVAVARGNGVHIDYMSATVQTSSIPDLLKISESNVIVATNKRFPIFAINSGQPLLDCLIEIVDDLLVRRDHQSRYLPPESFNIRSQVVEDVFGGNPRSHALLVALNTISGPRSDLAKVQTLLENNRPVFNGEPIDILLLSSKQTSSDQEMAKFDSIRTDLESRSRPYIVLATSVIEMGVTIPALDFVVTMDSGFQNVTVGDRSIPEIGPLPFNSLKQRLGRVGRKRAGVGIITREVGAPYTDYDVEHLNSADIEFEPVKTPLSTARLDSLALYTLASGWNTPSEIAGGLISLGLASEKRLLEIDRLLDLVTERRVLLSLGLAGEAGLTEVGLATQSWIGSGWLQYAVQLERSWRDGTDIAEVVFWLVSLAVSDLNLSAFCSNNSSIDELNSFDGPTATGRCFVDNLHSPLGRYDLVRSFYNVYADALTDRVGFKSVAAVGRASLSRDCSDMDLIENQILNAIEAVVGIKERFRKKHRKEARVSEIPHALPSLSATVRTRLIHRAHSLPGQEVLKIGPVPNGHPDARAWYLADGRAIASVSSAAPSLNNREAEEAQFSCRILLRRQADFNGFWLDVADHWVRAL